MGILGMTENQVKHASLQTQDDIDISNMENQRHLLEQELADLFTWRMEKCTEMLVTINKLFLTDYHRIKGQ